MTNKEKQDWLKYKYPLTIIADRYDGTYSGGGWLAFPLYCDEVPPAVDGYDEACAAFWKDYSEPVGKGNSAQSALDNLIKQMHEFKPEESEDERIRNEILIYIGAKQDIDLETHNRWCTYLEKQKEQKPAEYLDKDKVYAIMTKLTNLSYSQLIPINSDEFKKLHEITWDVRSLLDYPIEQKPAEWSEEDERMLSRCIKSVECSKQFADSETYKAAKDVEMNWLKFLPERFNLQPKQEWSEEDEKMKERLITRLNWITYNTRTDGTSPNITFFDEIEWLKSLRPQSHWKPSEEQMEALRVTLEYMPDTFKPRCTLETLQNDLKKHM